MPNKIIHWIIFLITRGIKKKNSKKLDRYLTIKEKNCTKKGGIHKTEFFREKQYLILSVFKPENYVPRRVFIISLALSMRMFFSLIMRDATSSISLLIAPAI